QGRAAKQEVGSQPGEDRFLGLGRIQTVNANAAPILGRGQTRVRDSVQVTTGNDVDFDIRMGVLEGAGEIRKDGAGSSRVVGIKKFVDDTNAHFVPISIGGASNRIASARDLS